MIIGISANYAEGTYRIAQEYADCVVRAGACAVILPVCEDKAIIEQYIESIDGLLLTGGGDMDPMFWGEEALEGSVLTPRKRDIYDLELYAAARRRCMPIMGICRGMQVMCIAEGGSLYQDIHKCFDATAMNHSPESDKREAAHSVRVKHSFFNAEVLCSRKKEGEVTKLGSLDVNSLHHQSINYLPEIFTLGAVADDGVIEAFVAEHYPMFGVQWHPEHLAATQDEHAGLFTRFVALANTYELAKAIHRDSLVIDSHTDSPMVWKDDTNMGEWQDEMLVDFPKMAAADVSATFMVAYLPQGKIGGEEQRAAKIKADETLERLRAEVEKADEVEIARTASELIKNKTQGKRSVALAIENGYALDNDISNVNYFHNKGVSYITLCHNGDNDVCDSAAGNGMHEGLSEYGKAIIQRMNRLGVMVDISHASDQTMEQAIEHSWLPIIASHSGARAVCSHRRNIPDNILKKIAHKGGVCQICLYEAFLNDDSNKATVADIVKHVKHIDKLVGIDYIGIGSDFDGGGGIRGCESENELINITMTLLNVGYSSKDVRKIMGENFVRVWSAQEHV